MKYRILVGVFSHETNTFCPMLADMEAFRQRKMYFGPDMLEQDEGEESSLTGFLRVLKNDPSYELIPSILFSTGPSGFVTKEMYDLALNEVLKTCLAMAPFDGVYLSLHGAMVAQGHPDAEGDFLESLREVVGESVPIIVTLDLHGNITRKMAKHATALIPCEEYPHIDSYILGQDAAKLLRDTLSGACVPTMAYRRIPYLLPLFPTSLPEIGVFLDMAKRYQREPGVRFARIAHGFFPSNIPEMGMSVMVITDNNQQKAEQIAEELSQTIWRGRDTLKRHYTPLDEALDMTMGDLPGPVVMGDGSDNPGAGGLCDTTHIMRRILERMISGAAVAVLRDPENVQRCMAAGIGATVSLDISGMSDRRLSGGPLPVTGIVEKLLDGKYRNQDAMERGLLVDMGPCAVLNVSGNRVVLSTNRTQVLDAEGFRACGIAPEKQKILVVKSAVHYRASFGRFAGKLVDLALPGYSAPDPNIFERLGFKLSWTE